MGGRFHRFASRATQKAKNPLFDYYARGYFPVQSQSRPQAISRLTARGSVAKRTAEKVREEDNSKRALENFARLGKGWKGVVP